MFEFASMSTAKRSDRVSEKRLYFSGLAVGFVATVLAQNSVLGPWLQWVTVVWALGFWLVLFLVSIGGYLLGIENDAAHGHGSHGHSHDPKNHHDHEKTHH